VIILPVVLLAMWLVLQVAIVMHAQHVAQAAAQDAAVAAASDSGSPEAIARSLMQRSAGGLTSGVGVSSGGDGEFVTVTVSASVVRIFPIGTYRVTETASAPIERFTPQPERP
jgi:uncharacterized membrane protein